MTQVRAVLFDAGNTLVFLNPERILELVRAAGVEVDEDAFHGADRAARRRFVSFLSEGATGTESHVWRHYFVSLFRGLGVPDDAMETVGDRLRESHARDHLWSYVQPGTLEVLRTLRSAGYPVAVLSNADGRVEALLEAQGLRSELDFVLDSHTVGLEKPDPGIFHLAVERFGLERREVLYVGDLYPVDVVGARNAGLQALLVDPHRAFGDVDADRIDSILELPGFLEGC